MKWHKISEELPPEDVFLTIKTNNAYTKEFIAKLNKDYEGRYIWVTLDDTRYYVINNDKWAEIEPPEDRKKDVE